jgi:hypothetical protein
MPNNPDHIPDAGEKVSDHIVDANKEDFPPEVIIAWLPGSISTMSVMTELYADLQHAEYVKRVINKEEALEALEALHDRHWRSDKYIFVSDERMKTIRKALEAFGGGR